MSGHTSIQSTLHGDFRDLLSRLTSQAWLAFIYAICLILVIYALSLWGDPTTVFLCIEIPTLAAVSYVLSANVRFRFHGPFLWAVTGLMVWSFFMAKTPVLNGPGKKELLPLCIIIVVLYWLTRAVSQAIKEFKDVRSSMSIGHAVASLLSFWGAFLQIAFIALVPINSFMIEEFEASVSGRHFLSFLELIRLSSPISWIPAGILSLGIALFIILRLQDEPYEARDYNAILAYELPPVASEILAAVRLPIWIVVVIVEFLKHIIAMAWKIIRSFSKEWIGRAYLIGFGFVMPTGSILLGHIAIFKGVELVGEHVLDKAGTPFVSSLLTVIGVHLLFVCGLAAYVVGVTPVGIRAEPVSIDAAPKLIRDYLYREGFPAAQAVGKAFVLFALVIIAVPISSLVPGGPGWGLFSTLYTLLLVCLIASYVLWDRLPEKERQKKLEAISQLGFWKVGEKFFAAQPTNSADAKSRAAD